MITTMYVFGNEADNDRLDIKAEDGTVWVRTHDRDSTVALTLDRQYRAKLRAALDELDKQEAA